MKLQNVTAVLLARDARGGLVVKRVIENPEVPGTAGKPVVGQYLRRLLTVKEVAAKEGVSLNKAADLRRERPLAYLADFPGQSPLPGAARPAA